jgi:hypothetical protein
MKYAERRDLEVPVERQRTGREQLGHRLRRGRRTRRSRAHGATACAHEPPPDAVMAAVRAIERDGPQRVKTLLWVKSNEHTFELPLVECIHPARHDRVRRRRGPGPRRGNAWRAVLDRQQARLRRDPQPATRTITMDHPSATGDRIARRKTPHRRRAHYLRSLQPRWPTERDHAAGTSRGGPRRRGTRP